MPKENVRLIQSVKRAMDIIECFDNANKELSLNEISEKVALSKSTVYGILSTLLAFSYIDKDAYNGKYRLGLKFLEKGIIVSESLDIKSVGYPYVKSLAYKYHVTSQINYYQNYAVYIVCRVEPSDAYIVFSSKLGSKLPIHATASGKMILASLNIETASRILQNEELTEYTKNTITDRNRLLEALETIREQGFSMEDEEIEPGVCSIAVPIKNYMNNVVAAISVSAFVSKIKENRDEIIRDLREAAASISRELGYRDEA